MDQGEPAISSLQTEAECLVNLTGFNSIVQITIVYGYAHVDAYEEKADDRVTV